MSFDLFGTLAGIASLLFVGGGLLLLRRLGARASSASQDAARARRQLVRRSAAVAVATTLAVLATGGVAALRLVLRPPPAKPVALGDAVDRFRCGAPAPDDAAPSCAGRLGPPPPGVYSYRAAGHWTTTAPVLGTERRDLPASVPAIVRAGADGWSIDLRYFDDTDKALDFAGAPGPTLQEPGGTMDARHFGFDSHTTVTCTPPGEVHAAPPGTAWTHACTVVTSGLMGATQHLESTDTMAGLERLCIGGTSLDAWHVRRTTTVSGSQRGTVRRDAWFSTTDGMLLKLDEESRTSGIADDEESIHLELASLVPHT